MSKKPPKYCQSHPCNNMAVPGTAYCTVHARARAPKDTDPFYLSVRWRRFRDWFISNHPMCMQCEREGRGDVLAQMVDHIVEIKDGGALTTEENAMSLCWKCHAIKHSNDRMTRKNRHVSTRNNRAGSTAVTFQKEL